MKIEESNIVEAEDYRVIIYPASRAFTTKEAKVITENWRNHYNQKRPHSSLGYRVPAPETILPIQYASA